MRLWSIAPAYLDTKGLVALWRESLLAKAVLQGKTRGYTNHPQLARFREQSDPMGAIGSYLEAVWHEASERGFRFDRSKLSDAGFDGKIPCTSGQLEFELQHLLGKLELRSVKQLPRMDLSLPIVPHPIFEIRSGKIEVWEKISPKLRKDN